MKMVKISLFLFFISIWGVSCSDKSQPNIEVIQDMMDSPAIKSQEYDENSAHHIGMRTPPAHTVPVGFKPYAYKGDPIGSEKDMNPLAKEESSEILQTGKKYFDIHCMICHGDKGQGGEATSVAQKMPLKPPSLLSDKVRKWTDGRIYNVISDGQGIMGPYDSHIPQKYRWQVVNYIRSLQKNNP